MERSLFLYDSPSAMRGDPSAHNQHNELKVALEELESAIAEVPHSSERIMRAAQHIHVREIFTSSALWATPPESLLSYSVAATGNEAADVLNEAGPINSQRQRVWYSTLIGVMSDLNLYAEGLSQLDPDVIIQQHKNNQAAIKKYISRNPDIFRRPLDNDLRRVAHVLLHCLHPAFSDIQFAEELWKQYLPVEFPQLTHPIDREQYIQVRKILFDHVAKRGNTELLLRMKLSQLTDEPAEFLTEQSQALLDDATYTINFPATSLESMVRIGRIVPTTEQHNDTPRHQFESYRWMRRQAERNLLLTAFGTWNDPYPVSAAIGVNDHFNKSYGCAPLFGSCHFELRPSIRQRSVFFSGDTFSTPTALPDEDINLGLALTYQKYSRDRINQLSTDSLTDDKQLVHERDYIEMIVFGQVTLDDILTVSIPEQYKESYSGVIKELKRKAPHISVRYAKNTIYLDE